MATLVINAGSVTIKYKLFDESLNLLLAGLIDNKNGRYVSEIIKNGKEYSWDITKEEFAASAQLILNECKDHEITKIGFRIVHGGEKFIEPTLLNEGVLKELETLNSLAPLHNPPALKKVREFKDLLKDTPFYAVFDTAFHSKMPPKAYMYALPYEYYQMYSIRKYGFHGISHSYVVSELKKLEPAAKKIISCHLGGGASIAAIVDQNSIDTSMGFTPLEGLIMATRAGDVDDGAVYYLQEITHFNDDEFNEIQNKKSGLLGISGYTADMRTLLQDEAAGNERAHLAIEMYIYRIQKYIASYIGALNGVDALTITAGVGAGSDIIRKRIFENLSYFNLRVDPKINDGRINVAENLKISAFGSCPIWIVPTNEELEIARQIQNI
jgi:acetate kinase